MTSNGDDEKEEILDDEKDSVKAGDEEYGDDDCSYDDDDDDDDDDGIDPWGEDPDWVKNNLNGNTDSSESEKKDAFKPSAHHIVILIDTSPSMFEECVTIKSSNNNYNNTSESSSSSTTTTPFDVALKVCEKLLHYRVNNVALYKIGKRDGIGLSLYGTKRQYINNRRSISSTHELITLQPPGVNQILQIQKCLLKKHNIQEEFMDDTDATNAGNDDSSSSAATLINNNLKRYYDSAYPVAIRDANKMFRNAESVVNRKTIVTSTNDRFDTKSIWIFTNEDNPCSSGTEQDERRLVLAMEDIFDGDVTIKIFALPKLIINQQEQEKKQLSLFNIDLFYKKITNSKFEIISTTTNATAKGNSNIEEGKIDLDKIMNHASSHWRKPRRCFNLPILLPGWHNNTNNSHEKNKTPIGIMVDFFLIVSPMKRPIPLIVDSETNKIAYRTKQTYSEDTGELITPQELKQRIRTYVKLGDDRIPFTKKEIQNIKKKSNACPGFNSLILLGFKSKRLFCTNTIRNTNKGGGGGILERSYLIYPNDTLVSGSKVAFTALRASMIRKNVMAIGELLTRVTCTSRLVVILPLEDEEKEDINNETNQREEEEEQSKQKQRQKLPQGLLVIPLPYKNEYRRQQQNHQSSDTNTINIASEQQVNLAKNIIQKQSTLTKNKKWANNYKNPVLTNFFTFIESVALNKNSNSMDDTINETQMDKDAIKGCIGLDLDIEVFCNSLTSSSDSSNDAMKAEDIISSSMLMKDV